MPLEMQESKSRQDVWLSRTIWLLGLIGAVRVLYLVVVPVDLVHDEAYYWDWSRHPAWGYYSKPPMVAWLIGLSTWLGGSDAVFVRLPAAILSTSGSVFAALLARRMYGSAAGFWAAALAIFTPGNTVLSLVMTIDAPLLFAWSAALYFFWIALENPRSAIAYVGCAAALGVGCLSKQTMLGFLPLACLFLLISGSDRHRLRDWRLWMAAAVGLLCLTPVVVWNSHHNWVTLVHTSEHFSTESVSLTRRVVRSIEFLASQLAVISPITCLAFVGVSSSLVSRWSRVDRRQLFLLCFSAIPLLPICLLSLRQRVEANWPAPFYLSGFVLLAGAFDTSIDSRWLRWRGHALRCGIVFSLGTMLLPFLIEGLGGKGSRMDVAVRMWGWRDLSNTISSRLRELPQGEDTLLVVDRRRGVASELAFYLPHQPRVYVYNDSATVTSQYDVWGGPTVDAHGRDALILSEVPELSQNLDSAFSQITPLPDVTVPVGNGRTHHYYLWLGKSLEVWPTAQLSRHETATLR